MFSSELHSSFYCCFTWVVCATQLTYGNHLQVSLPSCRMLTWRTCQSHSVGPTKCNIRLHPLIQRRPKHPRAGHPTRKHAHQQGRARGPHARGVAPAEAAFRRLLWLEPHGRGPHASGDGTCPPVRHLSTLHLYGASHAEAIDPARRHRRLNGLPPVRMRSAGTRDEGGIGVSDGRIGRGSGNG